MRREAICSCGALRVTVDGEPVRISICHCLACQRRTGSAFGVQARFEASSVEVTGEHRAYVRVSDDGDERIFHFCPVCGATVFYTLTGLDGFVAVPVGAFADPDFPSPTVSIYESRRHPWVDVTAAIDRQD